MSERLGREEQARLEVGHTEITRPQKWVLVAFFLTLIFAVPVVQHVHELGAGQPTTLGRFVDLPANAMGVLRQDNPQSAGQATAAMGQAPPTPRSLWTNGLRANSVLLHDIQRFEDDLVSDSLLTKNLLPPVQELMTGMLGAGNEKAYVGRDGWLFYRPDVDYLTAPGFLDPSRLTARAQSGTEWKPAPQPDPLIAIFQFRLQLAERGIALIIVPTPTKPVVQPEKFSRRYQTAAEPIQNQSYGQFLDELADPARFFARYEQFLAPYRDVRADKASRSWHWPFRKALEELAPARELLQSQPVRVFDPAPLLVAACRADGSPQYLQTDTHWRPEAMERVAAELAGYIRSNGLLAEAPPAGYSQASAEVSNLGDIEVMMKLPPGQTIYKPERVTIKPVARGENAWRPDPNADVLLLGDSFSNIFSADNMGWGDSAGFAEQLSFHLQRPIDAITRNDAGAYATRELLSQELAKGVDRLAGKKLVIWQFATRELASGDWQVKSTPMALGRPRQAASAGLLELPEEQAEPLRVWATVREASPAPRPGTVTYPDHVVQVHLVDLCDEAGNPLPQCEALATCYSMRNQVWTDAARYRPGQRVHLSLENFDRADRRLKVSTVKSSMLEGDLALEIPCWAEPVAEAGSPTLAAVVEPYGGIGGRELLAAAVVLLGVLAVVCYADRKERREQMKGTA